MFPAIQIASESCSTSGTLLPPVPYRADMVGAIAVDGERQILAVAEEGRGLAAKLKEAMGDVELDAAVAPGAEEFIGERGEVELDAGDAAAIEGSQVGGRLIDRELDVRPSIRLRAGAPVRVLITRDLILEPYRP